MDIGDMYPWTGLIHRIDRFVRQRPVGNITRRQLDTGLDRLIGITDVVMILVAGFDIVQDFDRFIERSRFDQYFLEASFQSTVFLDILPVFVEGRRPDTLNLPSRQRRFQHICRIQATSRPSGSYNGMNLVDKKDNIFVFSQFVQNGFHPLFKLSPVFRTCNNRRDIQSYYPLIEQYPWHFFPDDTDRQPFGNSRFTDPRFSDQHRIIFLPPAQNLGQSFDFPVSPYDRIEGTFFSSFRDIYTEIIQYRGIRFSRPVLTIGIVHRFFVTCILVFIGFFSIIGLHTGFLLQQLFFKLLVIYSHRIKQFCDKPCLISQHGQHQMFRLYFLIPQLPGLLDDPFNNTVGSQGKIQLIGHLFTLIPLLIQFLFDFCFHLIKIHSQSDQNIDSPGLIHPQHPQKQMFGWNLRIPQTLCLFTS